MGNPQNAVFLYSKALEGLSFPEGNPFDLRRTVKAREALLSMDLLTGEGFGEREIPLATTEALERYHDSRYLGMLRTTGEFGTPEEALQMGLGTPDCPLFAGLYEYCCIAAGGSLEGARLILSEEAKVVFNPAGGLHHARAAEASGFCYVNDVVLACKTLVEAGKRVLFLDVDAHHGDGVQEAFYDTSQVMTISLHESGKTLFPGTGYVSEIGEGEGEGFSVNVPLPAGIYDNAYWKAFKSLVPPLIGAYAPDVIVLELGMDGLAGDPLTHMELTNNTYADVIEAVLRFDKPVLATGGGGYNVGNTSRGWALAWNVLSGEDDGEDLTIGLGGVMLESSDWKGGLRDRVRFPQPDECKPVDQEVDLVIKEVKESLFPLHGIS